MGAHNPRIPASKTIMARGIILVSVFYGCWSVIIIVGIATSFGAAVPPMVDMFGAWLSKLMPIVDGVILLQMMDRVVVKKDGLPAAAPSSPGVRPSASHRSLSVRASGGSVTAAGGGPRAGVSSSNPTLYQPLVNASGAGGGGGRSQQMAPVRPQAAGPPHPPQRRHDGLFMPPPLEVSVIHPSI